MFWARRLRTLGPKLGAVITITKELALKEARAADRRNGFVNGKNGTNGRRAPGARGRRTR